MAIIAHGRSNVKAIRNAVRAARDAVDADLVNEVADTLVREIEKTEADIVVSGCGQCKRMILNAIKARKVKLKVLDTVELMLEAGIEVQAKG